MPLDDFIRTKRTLVCVGSGGAGKTTVSAAIALWAAAHGRRALALTVDPARRLASSLGIDAFSEEQQRIDDTLLVRAGLTLTGSLDVAMLDTKSTFDRIVSRYAPSPETRDRILGSRFYRQASTALSGSQEYMAMERLYETREDGGQAHDLVVLDTPPSRHALDFLSAPDRLRGLMESRTVRTFLGSVSRLGRVSGALNRFVFKGMGRFLGADIFLEILEFLDSFSSMYDGFSERSRRVEELLRSDDLAFLVVSSADAVSVDEALYLRRTLEEQGLPFGAFVVNQAHLPFVAGAVPDDLEERVAAAMRDEPALGIFGRAIVERVAAKAVKTFREMRMQVDRDAPQLRLLHEAAGNGGVHVVPHFTEDIHDLANLYRFGSVLFSGPPDPARCAS